MDDKFHKSLKNCVFFHRFPGLTLNIVKFVLDLNAELRMNISNIKLIMRQKTSAHNIT